MRDNNNDNHLEEQIRRNFVEAIRQSGITQTLIAKRAGISNATLSDYIHKNKLPSLCTFVKICQTIDVSSSDILGI